MTLRDWQSDNIKLLLIALVVFGHLMEASAARNAGIHQLYMAIYAVHIPAFVFISGMHSRRRLLGADAFGIVITLIVFQLLYLALYRPVGDDWLSTPYWILWYLLSLLCWRAALPLFYRLRYPVIFAFALAFLSGTVPDIGYPLSLSRTLVFLPFFVAGHFHGASIAARCKAWRPLWLRFFLCAVACLAIGALLRLLPDQTWLYGSRSYHDLGMRWPQAMGLRSLEFGAGFAGILALFICVPDHRYSCSHLGRRVLSIYLLHGLVAVMLGGMIAVVAKNHALAAVTLAIIATLWLCYALSLRMPFRMVNALYRPLEIWRSWRNAFAQ